MNREWQIVVKILLFDYFEIYLINIGWIRIRMDPELLPGSGSGIKDSDPDPAKSERAYI